MTPELSIVFPAYNEEKRLPPTLNRVIDHLKEHYKEEYEIIIVNDGSTDNTKKVIAEYMKNNREIRTLNFPKNRGYGAAIREGILAARGNFILATDSDGSVNEEAILRFLNYMKKNPKIAMTVGSRTVKDAKIVTKQSTLRVFLGNIFLFVAKVLFGWPMEDRINGFKMFRRDAAHDAFRFQKFDTVIGAAEIVYIIEKRGYKYELLPILWTDYHGSKIKPFKESWRSVYSMIIILLNNKKGLYTKK